MKTEYHIDVTPEEDQLFRPVDATSSKNKQSSALSNVTSKKIFAIVLGAHILLVGAVGSNAIAGAMSSKKASNQIATDNANDKPPNSEQINNEKQYVESLTAAKKTEQQASPKENPNNVAKPMPSVQTVSKASKYTKTYTVKPGDTIYSISKKYKLNVNRLLEINNIKNSDIIKTGQTLKFVK